jgi:hypothetical protein
MTHFLRTNRFIGSALMLSPLLFSTTLFAQLPATPPSHIVVLIEENHSYSSIYGASAAPHINALAAMPNAAVFSNFHAITHPSQPNYLELYAGGNQGLTTDNPPATGTYPYTTANMGAELLGAGKTFLTYSEGLPSVGYDGVSSGYYVRKHNPCANWVNTGTPAANQYGPSVNQPFTAFPSYANLGTLPTVSYVVPNDLDDMHDGVDPSTITNGDTWMFNNLDSLRQWAMFNNTLYIITFDESYDSDPNNQILTIFFGPMVKGGMYSENVNLYNLLRTIEDLYGLGHAGAAATATPITDCWINFPTGVNNVANNGYTFQVVPNPASEMISFRSDKAINGAATVSITDVTGRTIGKYTITGTETSVKTSDFAAGVYYYKVENNNNALAQGQFVISHN